jgi:hypothetical protein
MTPIMQAAADNKRKMDWFFNQWVYGTGMPKYAFTHSFSKSPDGTVKLIHQSRAVGRG